MEVYFNEPRLNLTKLGDFFVKLVTYSFYAVLTAVTIIFLFSDLSSLRWLGVLFTIFLIHRLRHFQEADFSFFEKQKGRVNLARFLTPRAYHVLNYAFRRSLLARENFHLALVKTLIDDRAVKEIFKRLEVGREEFLEKIEEYLQALPAEKSDRKELSGFIETIIKDAYPKALAVNERFIEPRNIFAALGSLADPRLQKLFELFEIAPEDLAEGVIFGRFRKILGRLGRLPSVLGGFAHLAKVSRKRTMNRAWTARPTPLLDSVSVDLTNLARSEKVGFLVGHAREFERLLNVISRPGKPNVLLLGEPGSGKSTIIAHLAYRIGKDEVPEILFDKRLISLELGDLIANASPEILTSRLQKITEEIIAAENIVLFIPNVHDLFRTSERRALSVVDVILPVIKNNAIPVIGETYPREFKQYIESRSDFLDQFETVAVEEINPAEAVRFMVYVAIILEKEFRVFVTFRAIKKAVEIANRYFRNKPLPGSAVDLLKQALSRADQSGSKVLKADLVIEVAEGQSKIPLQRAGPTETQKLLNLESTIHERLVNQATAVRAVSGALREYRSGLSRRGGPIATFLFVGPTGVGKTELAKILTVIQFGSKELLARFDMSEYQDKSSIFRLIGTPDGEKTGSLTDAILNRPYSLILLDEFEKAHPDVLNLFLQVFDDGRLTDSLGRTVSFENTIIIATSNAHSEFIKTEIEKGIKIEEIAEELKKKLTEYFKPELLNRFSEVIVFRNLNLEEIYAITNILLQEVVALLKETHGINLSFRSSAVKKIAELGYSPVFGARPLRQVISERVRSPLAEKILKKELARGNKVELIFEENGFQFKIIE